VLGVLLTGLTLYRKLCSCDNWTCVVCSCEGYTLSYVKKGESNVVVFNVTPTALNQTISGLEPTTVYTVQLYASTQVGAGPSRSATVKTAVTPGLY